MSINHQITQTSVIEKKLERRDRWISFLTIFVIIGAWILVTSMKWVEPLFLPAPRDLSSALINLLPNLPSDIFDSLIRRILPGFVIGTLLGTILGVSMAMNRISRAIFNPIVEILRPLPPLALIPLLILWLGIGFSTQILLIAFGSFIILVVTSFEAVRNVPPIFIHAATMLGASSRQIFRRVIIPSIVPDIAGGIRVAVAASFGYDVAAELMGSMSGIGYRLVLARRYLLTENIIIILVVIALLSFSLDFLVRKMNTRITKWKSRIEEK
ncbi:MAG: ABC transporter permease subunit [Chloroflexi bacterium]|nr:ABC transporter permease subunit [Chloroflexota bacterium]